MKLIPYISFDGVCAQAIAFYEQVFSVKAEKCLYKDIAKFEAGATFEKGKEDWIMHACIKLADGVEFQLADCDESGKDTGKNICLQLSFKTAEQVTAIFDGLKDGGNVICPLSPTFYAPLYAVVVDKFGISWAIMQEFPQ